MNDAGERAETAAQLRAEAWTLLGESGLFALLETRFGEVAITGSAGYDLMVWRQIDLQVPCEADRAVEWAGFGGDIAMQLAAAGLTLHRASFLNDYVDPHPLGAGLYWGLEFRDFSGVPWKCEIWGWEPFDFAVRQARDDNFRADLSAVDRDLILALKTEALNRDAYYGTLVTSFDIYQFLIEGRGTTLEELEAWKGLR